MNARFSRGGDVVFYVGIATLLFAPFDLSVSTVRVDAVTGFDNPGCGGEVNSCASVRFVIKGVSSDDTTLLAAGIYTYDAGLDPCHSDQTAVARLQFVNYTLRDDNGAFANADWTNPAPETNVGQ